MPRPPLERPAPKLVAVPGRRNLYIRWTEPGTRRSQVVSTGTADPQEAERVLDDFLAALEAPPDAPTVSDVLDAYLRDRKGQAVAYPRLADACVALKRHLGRFRPDAIPPAAFKAHASRHKVEVKTYKAGIQRHTRTDRVAPGTVRRDLAVLRAAFNLARRRRWISDATEIPFPKKTTPAARAMTRDQGRALLDAAETAHLRLFIVLALATGARAGAILDLTWDRVDLELRAVDFRKPGRAETPKRRGVAPIGDTVVAALEAAADVAVSDHVIEWSGEPVRSIRTAFTKAAARAGAPWITPHVLKHSVVSWLAEDGYTVDQISDMTDTNPDTVRQTYRKVNPDALRPMAEALERAALAPRS